MVKREQYPYHRRFVRQRVRVSIRVGAGGRYSAWTLNVSADGICFEIPSPLEPGDTARLSIRLERGSTEPPVEAECEVVWRDRGKRGQRHGARFVSFASDGRQRLEAWLAGG